MMGVVLGEGGQEVTLLLLSRPAAELARFPSL